MLIIGKTISTYQNIQHAHQIVTPANYSYATEIACIDDPDLMGTSATVINAFNRNYNAIDAKR